MTTKYILVVEIPDNKRGVAAKVLERLLPFCTLWARFHKLDGSPYLLQNKYGIAGQVTVEQLHGELRRATEEG